MKVLPEVRVSRVRAHQCYVNPLSSSILLLLYMLLYFTFRPLEKPLLAYLLK